jgi:defect-in-organelle-trafficking protein DotD
MTGRPTNMCASASCTPIPASRSATPKSMCRRRSSNRPPVATPGMPNPEIALQQSIQHVDAEMAELGQLTPASISGSQPVMPEDLQRVVTFKWSGSLDQGVAKLAQSVGYTFYVTAPPGAQPLLVTVELANVPAYEVFKALGEEAGTRAVGGAGASRLPPGRLSRRWPPSSRRSTFARPRWSAARSRRASTRPR